MQQGHVEVREQVPEAGSLLPACRSWGTETQVLRLGGKGWYPLRPSDGILAPGFFAICLWALSCLDGELIREIN